ncbi:phage tail length tape measure family protein [Pasteurella multocida]|uniref:Phage tail length tape measure family protein n=1 Tax=Pasteurella multocida TaxID=747 RepID=A0AAW8VB26_PASMD|nr:phage tail length tape measure family protein [Pasteurella multocida]MDH7438308.1 phage tail length tape measure family protein [Pasteurella multocida]MDH7438616.1 phage tail length tape measure family protein [Pasteurella multocida]MDH7441049.1 phage tail length tape measure family protein [Pasteurella multocida]MDT3453454.1 phage tail length tape measure family protein [Pasteurella multocida]MDY0433589.1 phage tail length tape measure family protein [Pasteurella multocida]
MNQISNLKIKLTAETAKFTEEINKARNSLGKLGKAKGSIDLTKVALRGLAVTAGVVATAFAAVSAAAVQGISIYAETERYMARTEAQLKATGAAVGFTASELDKFARSVAMNTLASTDGIRNAMSVLMTFKSVTGDIFKQTISLAQDLAEVFKTDVASEARNLGRALETPTEAVSILKRKGIELSESQQELIKKFVESGEKAKAQELILHELQKRVGGAGQAAANDTVTGALDTLGQVTQELKEEFAKATGITDIFKKSVSGLAKAFLWLTETMRGPSLEDHITTLEKELDVLEKSKKSLEEKLSKTDDSESKDILKARDESIESTRKKLAEARAELQKQKEKAEVEQEEAKKLKQQKEDKEKQDASLASINALNNRLKTRREKLDAQYNKDIKMIQSLTLSKAQIEEQGFKNIEALRKAHIEKVTKQYNAEKAELDKLESKKSATAKSSYQDQLSVLDLRYATETQKIELNHQLQIKKIQQMSISEKDARAKGFSSALELRKHYLALENQAFDKAMTDQKEKIRREEQERSDKVRSFFNEIRGSGNDPYVQNDIIRDEQLAKAEEMHKQQLLSVEEFQKAKADIEDAYRKRKEDLDRESVQTQLGAAASLFDGLAGLMEATAGRNSSAYRTMFAISKSFQIAQSLLNLHAAVMKAMNDDGSLTTTERLAKMAAVASAGANVLNQLTSVTLSGARAMGGPVGGGRAYLVGEKGPEIFVPGASGQITSNENLNKALGGGSSKTVVINQTNNFGSEGANDQELAGMIAKLTKEQVYSVLAEESRAGGVLSG